MRGRAEITKAERRRSNPATTRCYICVEPILHRRKEIEGRFAFRGETYVICEGCRGRYWEPVKQAAKFGRRYAFIPRSAMPRSTEHHRSFQPIYATLLLAQERQKIQQKEVKWMVDEMTEKILKLPRRVAAIVRQTHAVMGDSFKLDDDIALQQIRDLLEDIDPNIMSIKKKKLSKP
jgi:hypothetical protein